MGVRRGTDLEEIHRTTKQFTDQIFHRNMSHGRFVLIESQPDMYIFWSFKFLTFGTSFANKSKMLCLPDLDTKSLQHTDGAVTANANEAARSFVGLDAFCRGIALVWYWALKFGDGNLLKLTILITDFLPSLVFKTTRGRVHIFFCFFDMTII